MTKHDLKVWMCESCILVSLLCSKDFFGKQSKCLCSRAVYDRIARKMLIKSVLY